jgi:hypothetical protein
MAQTYGLELEMVGLTTSQIADAINSVDGATYAGHFRYHGSRTLGDRHARFDGNDAVWVSESDSSLSCPRTGLTAEVVSPILYGREGLAHASRIMRALVRAGGRVNRSCGTHVTMGVQHISARFRRMSETTGSKQRVGGRVYELYDYFWDGICELVSESRRNHYYCSRPNNPNMQFGVGTKAYYRDNIHRMRDRGAVNLNKFISSGVIEFRMHNGTLNGSKITSWALLQHQIVSWALNSAPVDFRNYPQTLDGLMDMLNIGSDLRTALNLRASQTPVVVPTNRTWGNTSRGYGMSWRGE